MWTHKILKWLCNTKLFHQRADAPNHADGQTTALTYGIYSSNYSSNHTLQCVQTAAWWGWKGLVVAVWKEHLHVVYGSAFWLTTLRQRRSIVTAMTRVPWESTPKRNVSAKLTASSPTPTQTLCLPHPSSLSPIRLFKANPEQLLASPCDICSAGSTWNVAGWGAETGGHFTPAPCPSKDRPWHKAQHLNGSSMVNCVSLCVLEWGWQSIAAQHFPKTDRCTRLELHECNSYKMHGESIT